MQTDRRQKVQSETEEKSLDWKAGHAEARKEAEALVGEFIASADDKNSEWWREKFATLLAAWRGGEK